MYVLFFEREGLDMNHVLNNEIVALFNYKIMLTCRLENDIILSNKNGG